LKVLITKAAGYQDQSHVFPFVRSMVTYLERSGIEFTTAPNTGETVAVGVQWDPGIDVVTDLKSRGVKFIHRLDGRAKAVVKVYEKDDENRLINAIADWTVFQSAYVRSHTTKPCDTIFGTEAPICLTPQRGSIIYNGVDREVFHETGPREDLPVSADFNILHVAFTHGVRKGVGDLVNAARLLAGNPRIRFYCVGRQEQDQAFGHELKSLPNVTCLGVIVDRARLASIMRSCHVLMFPSRNDYCPNTVLEAMSCGLPVWYHPSGGTPELVRHAGLAAGVPMDENNPIYPLYVIKEFQRDFAARAVEMVKSRFTLEHMGRAYVDLFRALEEGRTPATETAAITRIA
jgi:glycosyltransferase involved in cell wall biosynthesis